MLVIFIILKENLMLMFHKNHIIYLFLSHVEKSFINFLINVLELIKIFYLSINYYILIFFPCYYY